MDERRDVLELLIRMRQAESIFRRLQIDIRISRIKKKNWWGQAFDAPAESTCFSFSCSFSLVPCYVPSPTDVRTLHNTSPVADLFKLSHYHQQKIMTVRRHRLLDSAEGPSPK